MSTTNPPQLFLLADHIKLSLLERQRAISLNLSPNSQDAQISRSLEQLRSGIESLESQLNNIPTPPPPHPTHRPNLPIPPLRRNTHLPTLTTPNDPSLSSDFQAAQSKKPRQVSKSVRFRDDDAEEDANRASLFPYRDDPSDAPPDQAELSNHQIHEYHSRVISEQDDQLDQLGASIGRQRELSMQIGDELDGQVVLLDDVEEGVDRHAGQFRRARGRLDRFSRKAKENWSLTVIVVLIVVLVLLIVITK
ncbi:uncharacterized protein N0V89_004938 [Didymosphaeria variabile]|uniref:t-SNARE coiled-coil homology domain-containing protein n=1 Tax=Didymosphaeria variabile TaxID=1932322 RepID=A0A9W9CA06_9PLEO|nr:uncharacterized protein N0V89_004938 [Didymosphaeria variabile]KAJ4353211.1 hypothetical protein N0V89_004938 [Didymosphaeria variabile]